MRRAGGLTPGARLRRWRRDRSGATAVEFALVAAPFFFMMFALIELGLLFVLDVVLETSMSETGRLVRTGQAHNSGMSQTQFRDEVCRRMSIFESQCQERLLVDVRVLPRYEGQTPPSPTDAEGELSDANMMFDMGGPGSIILISAWYPQPTFTPLIGQGTERAGTHRVLNATTSFRNEPF